jgi:Rrf2 family transcriptional regulator, iron-sulfur cluster assembly transcription factor
VVVGPAVKSAGETFLASLDTYSIEDLCQKADEKRVFSGSGAGTVDFAI